MVGLSGGVGGNTTVGRDGIEENMLALDVRASVLAGKTFFQAFTPYLVARAFGGPVFWKYRGEDQVGGDQYHFQLGAGAIVSLPERFDVFVEGIPLGERAGVVGLGYSF